MCIRDSSTGLRLRDPDGVQAPVELSAWLATAGGSVGLGGLPVWRAAQGGALSQAQAAVLWHSLAMSATVGVASALGGAPHPLLTHAGEAVLAFLSSTDDVFDMANPRRPAPTPRQRSQTWRGCATARRPAPATARRPAPVSYTHLTLPTIYSV